MDEFDKYIRKATVDGRELQKPLKNERHHFVVDADNKMTCPQRCFG